jgi:flagellar basal body-associated protein FliL
MQKNKKMSGAKKVAIGAGVAVLSAASAGAYYLFGPKAKAHQKKATMLMTKMKKEVMSEIKKAKTVTMPVYHNVVDKIATNYAKQYKIHKGDAKAFAKKLKSEWKK